jgi:photosynthetic reaction center H subunit
MPTGALTNHLDVAQVVLYAFWIFFACLILYLRREDKREGYPLESDRSAHIRVQGFPPIPQPKTFHLPHGGVYLAPNGEADTREVRAEPIGPWPGAPLQPTGNPLVDGVGPAAYAARAQTPDLTLEGEPKLVAMSASDFYLEADDPDPRGMVVVAGDGIAVGSVEDIWVDRSDAAIRYLEAEVGAAGGVRRALLPINFARIDASRRKVHVNALFAKHFADVPRLSQSDRITMREEDQITAYFAGGTLYAEPGRQEPLF